jgi:hypothetical protein
VSEASRNSRAKRAGNAKDAVSIGRRILLTGFNTLGMHEDAERAKVME